jgi:Transglutaminase-like superfamily
MTSSGERVSRQVFSSPSNALLALRMSGWMLVLPLAKRVVPFERLARIMSSDSRGKRVAGQERFVTLLACRLTRFSGSNCLERSLLLYRYLARAGANPTLVLGVGRGNRKRQSGHAWVVSDGVPVVDSEAELQSYEPVLAFGAGARRVPEPVATAARAR